MHIRDYHSLQKDTENVPAMEEFQQCSWHQPAAIALAGCIPRSHETVSVQCILSQQVFLALDFPRLLRVLGFLKTGLTSKELSRKGLNTSAFSTSFATSCPIPFNSCSHFPFCQDELLLSMEEMIPEYQPALLDSRAVSHGILPSRMLERPRMLDRPSSTLLKSMAEVVTFALFPPLRTMNSTTP